ncbi:hypothetical protein [Amycolatopsis nalaikhensis]|uniref:Immunity protein 50 of polymorphic toxin system n=1 Tax=Amycolatopsis nalaikhensis TaxID=715472 RepID=A0ABY8XBZ8_9PSEU|nr:hypothetical protein [Amycolatopsis sp. 2-2]WIV52928.1 hypothetical protein QP939_28740 [Amycolatopsis sp. 2-2]
MSRLIAAIDDTVEVEYGQFVLQEVSMNRNSLALPVPTGSWTAVGGAGGLLLHSAATDHYPTVRVELWDYSPPNDQHSGWDQVLDLTCDLTSEIRLQSVTATFGEHTLQLLAPGVHHARVAVGNQRDTVELGEGSFEAGVERWLIQLWPA